MKREDIYNGITEIDDALIDGALGKKKRRGAARFWVPAVAAGLAVCVGLTALWPRERDLPEVYSPAPGGTVQTLAAAVKPEQASRVNWIEDEAAYALWEQEQQVRWAAQKDCRGELDGFFNQVMEQFLSEGRGNKIVSPLNLYMALAMLAETTGGESRAQILDLLGAESMDALREQVGRVWNAAYCDDGSAATVLANSLWLREDMDYVQSAVDTLAEQYHASSFRGTMGSEAMDQALRDWVDQQTGGLLKEQSQGLFLDPNTVLALASTVYFRDKWGQIFLEEDTAPAVFHAPSGNVERDFLYQTIEDTAVYRGSRFTALRKWFDTSSGGWMWLVLPNRGTGPEELLGDEELDALLSGAWSGGDQEHYSRAKVRLAMPKFDISSDRELSEGLKALGVTDVFDDTLADFSPILGEDAEASVSAVEHAVRVAVDEEGCTAAAFTVITVMGNAAPAELETVDFTLDRPFLFAVQDTGYMTLFAGVVNEP